MVCGSPARSSGVPTMSGSAAKWLVHARWLSSTTRSAPSRASPSANSRPSRGTARSRGNSAGETAAPRRVMVPSGLAHSTELSR